MGNAESEPQDMPTRGLEPPSQFLSDSVREKTPVEYEIEEPGEDMMEEAEEMLSEPPPNLTTHTGRRLSLETHTTGFEDLELDALDTVEEAKSTPTKLQVPETENVLSPKTETPTAVATHSDRKEYDTPSPNSVVSSYTPKHTPETYTPSSKGTRGGSLPTPQQLPKRSMRRILEPDFCLQENYPRSLVVVIYGFRRMAMTAVERSEAEFVATSERSSDDDEVSFPFITKTTGSATDDTLVRCIHAGRLFTSTKSAPKDRPVSFVVPMVSPRDVPIIEVFMDGELAGTARIDSKPVRRTELDVDSADPVSLELYEEVIGEMLIQEYWEDDDFYERFVGESCARVSAAEGVIPLQFPFLGSPQYKVEAPLPKGKMLDVVERLKAMGHDPGLVTAGLAMDKPELDFVKVKFSNLLLSGGHYKAVEGWVPADTVVITKKKWDKRAAAILMQSAIRGRLSRIQTADSFDDALGIDPSCTLPVRDVHLEWPPHLRAVTITTPPAPEWMANISIPACGNYRPFSGRREVVETHVMFKIRVRSRDGKTWQALRSFDDFKKFEASTFRCRGPLFAEVDGTRQEVSFPASFPTFNRDPLIRRRQNALQFWLQAVVRRGHKSDLLREDLCHFLNVPADLRKKFGRGLLEMESTSEMSSVGDYGVRSPGVPPPGWDDPSEEKIEIISPGVPPPPLEPPPPLPEKEPAGAIPTQEQTVEAWEERIKRERKVYKKFALCYAQVTTSDGVLETVIDGVKETTKSYVAGDLIIQNPTGERYTMAADKFNQRYMKFDPALSDEPQDLDDALIAEGFEPYLPTGKIWAHTVTADDIAMFFPSNAFLASWGESFLVEEGDTIAVPYPNGGEVYRIEKQAMAATYALDVDV